MATDDSAQPEVSCLSPKRSQNTKGQTGTDGWRNEQKGTEAYSAVT